MSSVLQERMGAVETWRLNRPDRRNALTPELIGELDSLLANAENAGTRVAILSGEGLSFCAGADLGYMLECAETGVSPRPFLQSVCELTLAFEWSPVILIAALHGHAVAGGMELALACDLVIAAAGTLVGDGHVRNNLVPGGGASVRLQPKLGVGHSAWLALSGEVVPAETLLSTGWLHSVVPAGALESSAASLAETLCEQPRAAQQAFKAQLGAAVSPSDLDRELDAFDDHWTKSDVAGALRRFLNSKKELRSV